MDPNKYYEKISMFIQGVTPRGIFMPSILVRRLRIAVRFETERQCQMAKDN
jgi:hypothetical protein